MRATSQTEARTTPSDIAGRLLNCIRSRRFKAIARICARDIEFHAWTPTGHWSASDGRAAATIIETWFSPGAGSQVTYDATTIRRDTVVLECEIAWVVRAAPSAKFPDPPADPRMLRQVYVLTVKKGAITSAHVYCAGLHTAFPPVDLERLRRVKSLALRSPAPSAANGRAAIPPLRIAR